MKPLVTVLYEDAKIGKEFPLHDLVLRMVEDEINGQTWRLHKVVSDNPKGGVDKVLEDVRRADLIAGAGQLFVLVDRDAIVRHVNQTARDDEPRLSEDAEDEEIAATIRARGGEAADRVHVFLLHPDMEGLIQAVAACAPGQWSEQVGRALAKKPTARDFVLREVAKAPMEAVRKCLRERQPGLERLASTLSGVVPPEAIA